MMADNLGSHARPGWWSRLDGSKKFLVVALIVFDTIINLSILATAVWGSLQQAVVFACIFYGIVAAIVVMIALIIAFDE